MSSNSTPGAAQPPCLCRAVKLPGPRAGGTASSEINTGEDQCISAAGSVSCTSAEIPCIQGSTRDALPTVAPDTAPKGKKHRRTSGVSTRKNGRKAVPGKKSNGLLSDVTEKRKREVPRVFLRILPIDAAITETERHGGGTAAGPRPPEETSCAGAPPAPDGHCPAARRNFGSGWKLRPRSFRTGTYATADSKVM